MNHMEIPGRSERALLDLVLDVIPADRGAVLRPTGTPPLFETIAHRERVGAGNGPEIDPALLRRVASDSMGLLARDVPPQHSSVLAAPMVAFNKTVGVIWLEETGPASHLGACDLKLLIALASAAGVAFESTRLVEAPRPANRQVRVDREVGGHEILGSSAAIREIYRWLIKVAPTDSTVLLRGETGTGKELVARALHWNSPRASKPFVAINCASLGESLLESELFGHERGAFTGAVALKRGKLEMADGGTVLLDEVGELPIGVQARLLRVLEAREFERVGGTRPLRIDVRLIAATNRDLDEAVREHRFRTDLYYRLNVVSLTIPPLRDHREDIALLAGYYVARYSERFHRYVEGISPDANACLVNYDWPGNVRELENVIERAVVLGTSHLIVPEDLPPVVRAHRAPERLHLVGYHAAVREAKRKLILDAVAASGGNCAEAAKRLALHPTYLHRLVTRLDLRNVVKR